MSKALPALLSITISVAAFDGLPHESDRPAQTNIPRVEVGTILNHVGELLQENSLRSIDSAINLLDSAVQVVEEHFGAEDTLLAWIHYRLAECYHSRSDYEASLAHAQRSLDLWGRIEGDQHIQVLRVYNVLVERGLHKLDLVACEQASEVRFGILDSLDRPLSTSEQEQLVEALNDRARLKALQARYDEAIDDLQLAIELLTDEMEEADRLRAALTGNIGWVLGLMGRLSEAERYIAKAGELTKNAYHPRHPLVLTALNFLSELARRQGHHRRADSLSNEEVSLCEAIHGPTNPRFAAALTTRARVLLAQGKAAQAVEAAERAVAVNKAASNYPTDRLMGSLETAGSALLAAGHYDLAVQRYDELLVARRSFLKTVFGYASEQQKLAYVQAYPPIIDALICCALIQPRAETIRTALDMIVNGKGIAVDAVASEHTAAICSNDPMLDSLLDCRKKVCNEIARLSISKHIDEGYVRELLDSLYVRMGEIETSLSESCATLSTRAVQSDISSSTLSSVLTARSVVLEFLKYNGHCPGSRGEGSASPSESYVVATLVPGGEVSLFDLGDAAAIDSLIEIYHDAMSMAQQDHLTGHRQEALSKYIDVSSRLYDRIVGPIRQSLAGKETVYVVGDGQINLVPFETLVGSSNRYLIEDHQFLYLTSARDLIKPGRGIHTRHAIVVAHPDYMSDACPEAMPSALGSGLATRGDSHSPECLGNMFSPLPTTRQEGAKVAEILKRRGDYTVTLLESAQAQEAVVKFPDEVPRVLHLATHAYFCSEADRDAMTNPLVRSGLILAGANRTIGGLDEDDGAGEDGILTALEASGLNLVGTELVVISACQTGIGEVRNGEGVFGLRRAFQHAGAESMITSMFSIPDESTAVLMERFYENWLSGMNKSTALRNASLSLLEDRRRCGQSEHPLFWGGFVLVGDSR